MQLNKIVQNTKERLKLRRMQYIQDQEGIARRYMREKSNWDLHFKSSKEFILKSATNKKKERAIVLGSGWLLDLPIDELADQFNEVLLYDINHPKQILQKIKKYKNVFPITKDITEGLIDYFYHSVKETNPLNISDAFSLKLPESDFVISLNVMCQLHIILIDYIKKFNKYSKKDLQLIELEIQKSHIKALPHGKSCLITDYEEEIYDEDDQLLGVNPLIKVNLPTGNFTNKWQWKFDSKMTYREDAKTYFNTMALDF